MLCREVLRVDKYSRKGGVKPANCQKVSDSNKQGDFAEKEAKEHVDESPGTNCCTISGNGVTKWKLTSSSNRVELMKADSGIIFFYDRKLNVEDD